MCSCGLHRELRRRNLNIFLVFFFSDFTSTLYPRSTARPIRCSSRTSCQRLPGCRYTRRCYLLPRSLRDHHPRKLRPRVGWVGAGIGGHHAMRRAKATSIPVCAHRLDAYVAHKRVCAATAAVCNDGALLRIMRETRGSYQLQRLQSLRRLRHVHCVRGVVLHRVTWIHKVVGAKLGGRRDEPAATPQVAEDAGMCLPPGCLDEA